MPSVMLLSTNSESAPEIVYVDDDNVSGYEDGSLLHPYNTISEGVDAVADGGTVHVFEGNYTESVEVRKSLILEGASSSQTILSNQSQDLILIWADNVSLRNLHITAGLYHGINVQFSTNITIENIILSNLTRAVYVVSSSHITLSDVHIADVDYGVLAVHLENSSVTNVVVERATGVAQAIIHAKNVTSSDNLVRDSYRGILAAGYPLSSSNITIQGNTVLDSAGTGIGVVSASDSRVWDNIVVGGVQCLVGADSVELEVSRNRFEDCFHSIRLVNVSGANIYHNDIFPNGIIPPGVEDDNPIANDWHHPELLEGNYWSNYSGLDDGSGVGKHAIMGDGIGDTDIPYPGPGFDSYPYITEGGWLDATPSRSLTLDIDPDTLNLKSKGRWITAYLSAENASVHDMDVSTILLQDALAPERWDYQDDVLMLKFDRQALIAILEVGESVEIRLSGKWEDGTVFEAYDNIRVIDPEK